MPSNEAIPFIDGPVTQLTGLATAAITGKRMVAISANRESGPGLAADGSTGVNYKIAHAGAGAKALGVAAYDIANGARGPVIVEGVVPVTASGSIAAGAQVEVASTGKVATLNTGKAVGIALTGAADGDDAEILLTP